MSSLHVKAAGVLHDAWVLSRRTDVLSDWFARLVPRGVRLLDVGCGDGSISALLHAKRPDIEIQGIEVLLRSSARLPVGSFDGTHIPYADGAFDIVMFSDVLHHAAHPVALQREARRVASRHVIIKDHCLKGFAAARRLSFMDWVGNARFGVALPYNYWTETQWQQIWRDIGLSPKQLITRLGLYPAPADWIFGAQLHFIALLDRSAGTQ